MSHLMRKKTRGGNNAKPPETRQRFLRAYEESCGNVSASCSAAGISRRTFYRWRNSPSRVNQKFREALSRIRPSERLLDLAEAVVIQKLQEGDAVSARYLLDRRGRSRGYGGNGEASAVPLAPTVTGVPDIPLIEKVAAAARACMAKYADQIETDEERKDLVRRFAMARNVDPTELEKRIGISPGKLDEGNVGA